MTATVRALIAVLVIVVIACAAALYVGYRSGVDSVARAGNSLQVATTSLDGLLTDADNGDELLSDAVHQIDAVYYKPVNDQVMLDGERKALIAYLAHAKVAKPNAIAIPAVKADDDPDNDALAAQKMLDYAREKYRTKLTGNEDSLLTEAALAGVATMPADPYTVYLSAKQLQGLDESLSGGNFGGIGVYIEQLKDGRVFVLPIKGLPAASAGMKPGEIVVSVDGTSVKGKTLDAVEQMIRGPQGTTVRMKMHPYKSPAKLHTYAIVRQIIHVPTVYAKRENGYEYVRLSDFGQTSYDEVRKALLDGKAHHVKGYILDLRDNGGGLVTAAVNISSLFIPSGTIVSTIGRDGVAAGQPADSDEFVPGLRPLVVLVNKYTASASEITSGAIQDYKVGTILGTKTFGKGVVQTIYPMRDGGALKITTQRYVTPKGRDIQHRGIIPDTVVDLDADDPSLIDSPADKQLKAAKALLARETR